MAEPFDPDSGVITRSKTKIERKLQQPRMFRVLLHNDDYTTRDFVVEVLRSVFHKSEEAAVEIMILVHTRGVGLAGVYTFEIAETKVATVQELARQREFPLRLSLEPEPEEV